MLLIVLSFLTINALPYFISGGGFATTIILTFFVFFIVVFFILKKQATVVLNPFFSSKAEKKGLFLILALLHYWSLHFQRLSFLNLYYVYRLVKLLEPARLLENDSEIDDVGAVLHKATQIALFTNITRALEYRLKYYIRVYQHIKKQIEPIRLQYKMGAFFSIYFRNG